MRAVVALRILLLLVTGGAVALGVALGVRDVSRADGGGHFACPMHPEVRSAKPGQCPICRMALEPANHDSKGLHEGAMASMDDIAAVENVRKHRIIDVVRMRSLPFELRELRAPAEVADDGSVTALFYADQVEAMTTDEHATFTLTRAPGTAFSAAKTADPPVAWDASTSKVRFHLNTRTTPAPKPGEVGWLELERKPRDVLGVPTSALLQSPEGPYVLVSRGGMSYEKRLVRVGATYSRHGFAVVLSGLRAHDRVVGRAAFFLDADLRSAGDAPEMSEASP